MTFSKQVIVRIRENDERYLTLSPVSDSALGSSNPEFMAKEGGITNGKNELTISLNDTLPYELQIPYTVGFSPHTTAATSDDFKMSGGTAKIPADNMSVTIDVGIVDDNRVEPTEYFTLQFRAPSKPDDPGNALGTFNPVNFQESKVRTQPLSVSIMDNDTAPAGGVVYLRGEGGGGITGFPSTRKTLTEGQSTEGQSTTITAEIAGAAPTSDIRIPLKVTGFPSDEATSDDYDIPEFITILANQKSGSVTLKITDDAVDERYRELLVVEINDTNNFPTGYTKGDRSKYEVVMLDNDKTPASLQSLNRTALTEATGARTATFQLRIDRRPRADPTDSPPFTGKDAGTDEGNAQLVLGYTGTATRGADYNNTPLSFNISKSGTTLPNGCSASGEAVTCTVTLTVKDDNLYEGGAGTTESVKVDLNAGGSSFNDGIKRASGYEPLKLTIEDDDLQPMFSIADVSGPENGNLTFTVKRDGAQGNNVSVTAGTGSHSGATNSATARTDYTEKSGSLRFEKGNTSKTFVVAITDDNIDEDDETFAVTLSNPVDNQGLPEPAIKPDSKTAVGTITDNDDAPTELTISVDTATIAEAADPTTVTVTATIDSDTRFATDQIVTITVGNADNAGEASEGAGGDYETVDQFTITIPATEASGKGTFELTLIDDEIDDDDEKISVEGELGGMTVTHATIKIEDDDTRGITVSKATLTINEADNLATSDKEENKGTYEVALTSQPEGGTVTVDITNPGPTVATADPSSLTFTADNWEMAQTVTMIAKDDTIDDIGDQKTTTITHSVSADGTDYADEEVADVEVTVRDDDEAPMALTLTVDTGTDGDQDTISEGATTPTVQITATLDGDTEFATDQTITITVGDSDEDTATEGQGGDYATVDEFNITLPAKAASVSHNLTLTLHDDDVDEPDETVTVAGELAGVTVKGTSFTIADNDDTPTVTLVLTPASINESGGTNASTVTATMDGKSSEAVTLTVSAMPVSPAVAGDLTLSDNKTLTIPANTQASTGVVTIAAVDNDVDAMDKTVTIAATATGGNTLVKAPGNQTLTITDDDTRGITVSKATLTLDEEDNAGTTEAKEHEGTYTVVLDSEPSGGTVTIGVASADTTIAGVAPATLMFTASNWSEPQTVTVTAVADGIDNEMDRRTAAITHTVTATGTDYEDASASAVTVTVNDDDGPSTLSINSPSVTEVDGTATATLTFTVQLLPQSDKQVTVAYADAGTGTATSGGTDYANLASGTLTFAPNETSKSVAVTVSGDDIDESDETVVVRLSSPSNATLTGGATTLDGTGTINDNDPTPTVSVADAAAVSEGNVAAPDPPNNMTFAVTLSAVSGLDVTVPYTLSGTATAGTDYTEPDPRSVTIAAGTTQANIAIPVAGDEVDEENETITVTLGTPTNATVSTAEGAGAASGTITDDDTRGVSVTPTALTVAEADNAGTAATRENQETYKVVLTSQPTGAVTVNLESGDESVARIDTASLVFGTGDWNTERTVTVTGQPDNIDNTGNERTTTIAHTVSAAGTDYADETAEGVTVTVTDDDAAPSGITLTANPDSVTENGGAKTVTVTAAVNGATRYAQARTVSVSVGGGTAISGTDYTAVESFDITIGAGEDDASNTFTLTPENDVLAEGNETIDVTGILSGITITPDEITLTDDDAVPSGITLSVDTNGAEDGTPSTVAEDAGATVVTVTATVNGDTRYVEAKTVAVSVADGTAASPADYAAVNNFNITIAAGAASHTGSFTVTPVDDDLDEANETIDVTGTLTDITVTAATVTFTDNDDPVSFSIANAEATEGGKVAFTVSREGAGDNVATVKVATATDSGDGVNAADADDYTAIATAQTLNFAKGVTSQTVDVQTTQDDLFEPDETFLVNLSAPALADGDPGTGISIETGKGTATGTIKNDDTEPSFAVADASATEGDGITFTVTRSGAMDNAVSVKWNTKPDTGADAASATDYTPVTAATTLSFAKDVGTQTFTVATTEDVLAEGNETFLVELTGAEGGTIATAEATGTITDDDAAPSGITLSVDTNGATSGTPNTVAEDAGATVVTVTATVNGTTRYVDAKTLAVSVADGTAVFPADYAAVSGFNITIAAGAASHTGSFTVTPVDDDLDEANETIDVTGTLSSVTITGATVTFTDNDDPVSFSIADAEATEGGKVTFTVSRKGAEDNVASVKIATAADSGDDVNAAGTDDYTAIAAAQTLNFAKGDTIQTVEVQTTQDDLFEPDETFKAVLSDPALGDGDPGTGVSIESGKGTAIGTIKNDDTQPSFAVADASASEGDAITFTVTRSGAMDNAVSVKWNTKAATGAGAAATSDYTAMTTATKLDFAKGVSSQTFTVATTEDTLHEGNETFLIELTEPVGAIISDAEATGTINDDDAAPTGITLSVDTNGSTSGTPSTVAEDAGATVVTVTATVNGTTRYVDAKTVAVSVDDGTAASPADYAAVSGFNITIAAGAASHTGSFTVTPVDDNLDESNETINVTGTLSSVTVAAATVTLTDTDDPVSFSIADAEATEGGKVTFTVNRAGAGDNEAEVKIATSADSGDDVNAAGTDDYTAIATARTLNFAKGVTSQTVEVQTTQDDLFEPDETFKAVLSAPALGENDPGTGVSIESGKGRAIGTIKNDDTQPSFAVADASADEGDAITFTVTRSGAMDNAVSVKWNTKADSSDGASAASTSDYTAVTTAQTLSFAKGVSSRTFTVATTEDVLAEGNETFLVELTEAVGATIATAQATGTINDDDDAPGGITLSVDTNGSTSGTPNTVAEDAGATVVTVTATVNGTTRYVDAKTVAVSVADGTAVSPADYAAVSGFNITIAAGAASHTGVFTVTPVDDNLDEADETIDVTGTLTDITITAATVTLTDTDDPVSFSITDAEATEGGKVEFTVSRKGAGDNVASVKVTTATDSGDGVNAADADDYTAIATAQTVNFAKGITSQTVEVQTTQDDLFEPDETFKAVLSDPALGDGDPGTGVSIESGKGTAIGTIKNDDTQPSFAVADASASEGDAITFTVTRSGAMDNAVSVKWNTKADSSDGANAASASDYTAMPTATKLDFAKGISSQTFTVATTEDVLDEENETFLVELTGAEGGTIATAEATGTITDDDAAPTGITLTVAPATVGEEDGETRITVTATVTGTTRYVDAQTVTVSVGGGSATSATDYDAVANFDITIAAGAASKAGTFDLTPTDDDLHEGSETIDVTGTSNALTITKASITLEDDDAQPSFAVADASASEGDVITFTVTRSGAMDNVVSVKWNTKPDTGAGAASATDYTEMTTATKLDFAKGEGTQTFTVATTEDTLNEANETFLIELTEPVGATIADAEATGTINDDDAAPTTLTLAVDADNNTENVQSSLAENGGAKTVKVTATLGGSTQFDVDKTLTLIVGDDDDSATEGADYTTVANITLTIPAGDQDVEHTFTLTPTDDAFNEASETISFDATLTGVIVTGASITLTSDDAAPAITLTVDADKDTDNVQTSLAEDGGVKTVRVTATLDGTTRLEEAADLTLAVGKDGDSAVEGTDYSTVADRTITIGAGIASVTDDFTLTPTNDNLYEGSETISLDGTLTGVTVTDTSLTLTDDDTQPSFAVADASAAEGDAITFTVTRSGAMDNAVSVKWNTKAATGAGAAATSDYTAMTTATKLDFAKGVSSQTFTVATTEDTLHEGNETFLIELTEPVGAIISDAEATGTINDDDAAPTGITLSVDTNGSTSGTPSTVAEDAGATVVTVTATVNGTTRYVDAKTVAVSVDDGTAASPADYAAVSGFNITIAAGAASHTGSFTVTPVDDNLDESNETINVTGTLSSVTVAAATVTLTDTDDPVSFSIADAEATEGGKVTFTVNRAGAGDNEAEVKIATSADSGDDVNAAGTDDYTAIATARTLNFAKGVTSQTVEVQTTQDDLFEPDETFKAVLSAPALGENDPGTGVSIESGKGRAIGTIKNDDTQPSFAVADASADEGDAITFTVTRSGAMDNAVSVKWNTKADSSDGASAASTSDYTAVTTAQTLSFAKGVSSRTFTVATTEDTLHEGNETFLVELTGAVGATISDAEATGTINDDDVAPSTLTLTVDADTGTMGTQTSLAEDGGAKTVRVTATLGGSSTFTEAKTVTVEVGPDADGATEGTDYREVTSKSITIDAGSLSGYVDFTLTPTNDDIDEPNEGISIEGTLTGVTVTGTSLTITDDEVTPTVTLVLMPTTINESGGTNSSTVTATLSGKSSVAVTLTVAAVAGADTVAADFTVTTNKTLTIAAGATTSAGTVTITAVDNDVDAPNKSVTVSATASGGGVANPDNKTLTITDDEGVPTVTLALDPTTINESGATNSSTVTATLSGKSNAAVTLTVAAAAGANTAAADFTLSTTTTLTIAAGATTSTGAVTITAVDNDIDAPNKTVTVSATASGGGVANPADQTLTINDDEVTPTVTLVLTPTTINESGNGNASTVTAMLSGKSSAAVTVEVSVPNTAPVTLSGNTTLTIAAGSKASTGTVTITAVDNDVDAPNKTVMVSATASGRDVANPASQTLTITDDDAAPSGITLSVSPATVGEEDGETEIMVTATVNGTTRYADARTVTVSVGGGTAISGTDYDAVPSFDITIAAGDASKTGTFDLTPTNDVLDEANEMINVTGTSGSLTITPTTVTITDDDDAPSGITLTVSPATVGEGAGETEITVTATVNGTTRYVDAQTVTVSVGDGTAISDTDYGAVPNFDITIAAGDASKAGTFDLTPTQDDLHEGSETIDVTGSSGALSITKAEITLTDDDGQPSFAVADASAAEGDAITFTVTRSGAMDNAVSVKWNTKAATGAGAAATSDYTAMTTATKLDFAKGVSSQTFTVATTEDTLHEGNETFLIELTEPVGAIISDAEATGTINDDDAAPTGITLTVSPATVGEGAGETEITVTAMVNGSTRYVDAKTVTVSVGGGTATSDTDYDAVSNFDIVIAAGDASKTGTFDLTPTQDDLHEGSETIGLDGTVMGVTVTDASLTLTDDDGQPSFAVADASADEGETITFTVTRSGAMDNAVSVKWNTKAATGAGAASTSDYTAMTTATKLDFASGVSSQTFTVATTEDTLHEGNETFLVELTDPVGAIISDAEATGTITDDDAAPTALTLSVDADTGTNNVQTSLAEDGGAKTVRVTATLSGSSTFNVAKTVAVEIGADADGATEGTDYANLGTQNITINAGASSGYVEFTLTPTDDDIDEPNEGISIEGTLTDVTVIGTTITLTDDEGTPTVTLVLTPTTINERGATNASTVTATLSGESSAAVTVEVSVPNAAPVTLSGNTTLTIAAGSKASTGTVTITAVDNDVDAPNASVVVSGAASGGGVANPDNQTLTITDDEGTPTATLVLTPGTINESGNGNASTVTATLSGKSSVAVTLTVAAAAGADTVAADFTLSATTTLTIAAGATTSAGTVTITAVDNDIDAPNKSVTVSATASGGGVSDPTNQTLTITDDEGVPTVTLALDPTTINESGNGNASTVTATLSGKSSAAVTVTVSVPNGAPVTLSNNAILSIAAGATTSTGTVTITAVDNDVDAANASVVVSGAASGGGVTNPDNQTLTITDDEGTPTVTLVLDPTTINESGDDNASTVTATLSGESSAAVTVEVSVPNDAPVTLSANKTLTIAAGSKASTGVVTITAVDNDVDAPNKTVTVSATASGGGVSDPTDQTLTITDDEGTPTVTLVLTPTTINESGNGNASTVTATLSGESSAAVTVEVSVPNNAPVTLSGNTTLTIAAGSKASTGTVTITAVDNDVDAPNASVVVSGVAAGGGVAVANPGNQTLTITDDEGTPTVTLVLTPTAINESGNGNASTVTATLSGKSNTAVTLTVAAAAGADTAAGDFTVSNNKTLTIAAGGTTSTGTVKITAVNNNVDAPDKSVTVSAIASGGGVTNPDNQTLTIADDDAAPTGITLSVSPATLGEGDGLTQITVTAAVNGTTRYVDARTVTVSVGGGTAISGTDYGAVSNFDITIAAGDASQTGTFDLTPTDDALHEEDETIEVTGTSGALTITPATVTITDNDNAGPVGTVSLSTSRYEVLEGDSLSVTVNLSEAPAADTMIELEATSPGGYSATPGADYDGGVQTVTIRAGTTSGKAHIPTTRDNQNDPNETFKLAIRASELPGTVTLGEPDTAVVTIREPVSGITPPETATVVYAGRNSRILMPVPAGLKGHGIDVAFYFDWGPGTAQGGGDCREPGTDAVDWGHWPSYPEGMVRTGPLVRIAEDINTDTIELEIELCKGSVGKTFTASWDSLQWLGNPDRGFPGVKSYPFNAAAAHCTSTALCYTRVTIIGDTPDPDPEITIAAGGDITEGGDAVFTVQASPAPASDLEIALAIADDAVSDFLMDGEEGSKTVTIAAGSDTAIYTLATTDDDLEEANGGVSATLEAGTGYRVGSPSAATVAVADNDDDDDARATVVRVTGGADITEGGVARFTLTGAPAPSQDITVNLRVTQSGAFAGDGELGARTVTLGTDATVTVDIPTVDDSTLEDDGSLTIIVEPGTGYTPHATDATATVAVADNEEPTLPTIHIADVEAAEGDDLHFTFTLSHAVDHEVVVWWETRFGPNPHDDENGHGPSYGEAIPHADFRYADSRVTVYPGSTRGEFWVETFDDFHDEGRETLTVVLTEATGAIIADELAIGTIVNSDPMPAAWLARFGRTAAEQALDGIAGRIAASRSAGVRGTIAGQALSFNPGAPKSMSGTGGAANDNAAPSSLAGNDLPAQSDVARAFGAGHGGFGGSAQSRSVTAREALLGSSFTATGEKDGMGGSLAFWGRAAQSSFDGREGTFSLDGEVTTAMLGADYARGDWLAGMALMQSSGKGGGSFADPGSESGAGSGSARGAGGKVEATLTAAIPYLALQASERVKLWGALGHGVGEVMLKPELGEMLKSDISWSMASLGLRGDLLPTQESSGSESGGGGPALALVSDALWAGTSSEKTRGLAASDSDVTRLRLGLEGSWKAPLEGDASITPKLEMGIRHDGGDAETGFGVELGGGLAWADPALGLSLDVSGRTLIAHASDDLKDRGFAASLAFDPEPASERGPSLALTQDWGGQAKGGLDALFVDDPLEDRTGSGETTARWTAEGAYGFPAFSGRATGSPHVGLGLATAARDYSIGWRLTPAANANVPDISFGLKATRRESDWTKPEHTLGFEAIARW